MEQSPYNQYLVKLEGPPVHSSLLQADELQIVVYCKLQFSEWLVAEYNFQNGSLL